MEKVNLNNHTVTQGHTGSHSVTRVGILDEVDGFFTDDY